MEKEIFEMEFWDSYAGIVIVLERFETRELAEDEVKRLLKIFPYKDMTWEIKPIKYYCKL